MEAKNYIVTQCYGDEGIFYECAFALLSMSRLYDDGFLPDTGIWVYTDKPEWFSRFADCPLPLHFRKLHHDLITHWKGPNDFVHRLKIELLLDLLKGHQGNILYMDTDIVLTHRIDAILQDIANGALYMHVEEGQVNRSDNQVLKKLASFLNSNSKMKELDPHIADTHMWNAGVLGFNTSHPFILENTLSLTDRLYPAYPKHVVEQFCFSYYFQKEGPIKAASPYMMHYWNLKEMREVLRGFFTHFKDVKWEQLTALSGLLQPHIYMQEKTAFYLGRSLMGKIRKAKWYPHLPDMDQLPHQL